MKSLFFYLVQVIVVSGILYAYYYAALRNKKFHQYNRFYMLAAVVASILIPFLNIPVYFTSDDSSSEWIYALQNLSAPPVVVLAGGKEQAAGSVFSWQNLPYLLYAVVGLVAASRILISVRKLRKIMHQHPMEHLNGIRFINTAEPGTPFSFFRWLFWNNKIDLDSEKGEQIFRHEVFHIQQKHSMDIIFMEVISIIFWINPLFHLMKRELRAIHEFLADRFASSETEKWEYAEMLLMQALNTQHNLVHPFFHTQIKRRIAMITNPHKTSHQYLRKLLVLPLAALLVTLFAFSYRPKQADDQLMLMQELMLADTMPAPVPYIVKYDAEDKTTSSLAAIESDARVSPQLIIFNGKEYSREEFSEMTGKKDDEIVVESRSVLHTSANDQKAIARYGERARQGVLEFRGATLVSDTAKPATKIVLRGTASLKEEPLIVIDGKVQEDGNRALVNEEIKAENIQAITVLKDASATTKYGPKGAQGVIEITTKKTPEVVIKEVTVENLKKSEPPIVIQEVPLADIKKGMQKEANGKSENVQVIEVVKNPAIVGYGVTDPDGMQTRYVVADSAKMLQLSGQTSVANTRFTAVEVEPAFPGGATAWYSFLRDNIDPTVPVKNGAHAGRYTIRLRMKVNSNGELSDLTPLTNNGFGMEEEVMRIMKKSPKWTPAYQNGHAVNAYRIQLFTFLIDEEKAKEEVSSKWDMPSSTLQASSLIYPNPAANNVTLKTTAEEGGPVVIRVMDLAGNEKSRSNGTLVKGQNSFNIPVSSLSAGSYIIRLDGPGKGHHLSMQLLKK